MNSANPSFYFDWSRMKSWIYSPETGRGAEHINNDQQTTNTEERRRQSYLNLLTAHLGLAIWLQVDLLLHGKLYILTWRLSLLDMELRFKLSWEKLGKTLARCCVECWVECEVLLSNVVRRPTDRRLTPPEDTSGVVALSGENSSWRQFNQVDARSLSWISSPGSTKQWCKVLQFVSNEFEVWSSLLILCLVDSHQMRGDGDVLLG